MIYVEFSSEYSELDSAELNIYTDPIERFFEGEGEYIDYKPMVIFNCEYDEKDDTINMSHWVGACECDTSHTTYHYNEKFKCWITLWGRSEEDAYEMGVLNFNEYFKNK